MKCVTETKNVSVLFYKNVKSSLSTMTLRFLYILGCSGPRCAIPILLTYLTNFLLKVFLEEISLMQMQSFKFKNFLNSIFLQNLRLLLYSFYKNTIGAYISWHGGVFRILILWVLIVDKMFIQHPKFFPTVLKCPKIAGAKTPIAPVLNTAPLLSIG